MRVGDSQVLLRVQKLRHTAEGICALNGKIVKAKASTHEMYSAIDELLDRIATQVRKRKERLISHKPKAGKRSRLSLREGVSLGEAGMRVSRPVPATLRLEEARRRLATESSALLVFVDALSGKVQVLRRVADGNLELIDPQV
jgi:ribosome-associated translation inhibitor RaiA